MLFANHAQQLNASISGIQNRIDELEALLKGLRSDKANLEAELQTILTLEGAAESAINQVQSFVNAAGSMGRNDLISTFWDAMSAMQNPSIAQLPEGNDQVEESEPDAPTPPDTDNQAIEVSEVVQVEVVEETETTKLLGKKFSVSFDETETTETVESTAEPKLKSVGSAAFNPNEASFNELKAWVRGYQSDDETRKYGKLSARNTWDIAAAKLIG